MKLLSYNVMIGGIYEGDWVAAPGRLSDVMKVIETLDPDIIGVQETLSWKKRKEVARSVISELRKIYKHEVIYDNDRDEEPFKTWDTGCALFSKEKPDSSKVIDERIRAVEMTFGEVSISCVYLSHMNEDIRLVQIKPVLEKLNNDGKKYRIIMGILMLFRPMMYTRKRRYLN